MKVNVGNVDRVLRISSGVVIVTFTALGMISPWGWLAIGRISGLGIQDNFLFTANQSKMAAYVLRHHRNFWNFAKCCL